MTAGFEFAGFVGFEANFELNELADDEREPLAVALACGSRSCCMSMGFFSVARGRFFVVCASPFAIAASLRRPWTAAMRFASERQVAVEM